LTNFIRLQLIRHSGAEVHIWDPTSFLKNVATLCYHHNFIINKCIFLQSLYPIWIFFLHQWVLDHEVLKLPDHILKISAPLYVYSLYVPYIIQRWIYYYKRTYLNAKFIVFWKHCFPSTKFISYIKKLKKGNFFLHFLILLVHF